MLSTKTVFSITKTKKQQLQNITKHLHRMLTASAHTSMGPILASLQDQQPVDRH